MLVYEIRLAYYRRDFAERQQMFPRFHYVGPEQIRLAAAGSSAGRVITDQDELQSWLRDEANDLAAEDGWCTYVVDLEGCLRLAPRRSEHVACAGGDAVLAAGEISFSAEGRVEDVSNVSTGYCPREDCWPAMHHALERARIESPQQFTFLAIFRLCPNCQQRNLVKDDWFYCDLCESELPATWNFRSSTTDLEPRQDARSPADH